MRILNGISSVSLQSTKYLVDALRSLNFNSDIVIYKENKLLKNFEDINLNLNLKSYHKYPIYFIKLFIFFFYCLYNYDVFHFHFGHSLLPKNLDLSILKQLNKKVYMEYHGSDIRRKKAYKDKPLNISDIKLKTNKESYRKQKRIAKYVDGIIVHDQELYEHLFDFGQKNYILPLRIDTEKFKPNFPKETNKVRIVHAPSKRGIKGTSFIISAIKSLSKKFNIEFILVENKSHAEAIEIYKNADIVIDQLLIGSYGMLSIEAMALGKPTICYIRDDLLETFPNGLPIFNANKYNIEIKLEELITNWSLRNKLGRRGRDYIINYHDSKKIAKMAIEIYQN